MSYTPEQLADLDNQIEDLIRTQRTKKLSPEQIYHVFKIIPDHDAALMIMALMLIRLERSEAKLESLRKDGLAF